MNGDTDGRLCGSDCVNGDTDGRVAASQPGGWGGDRDRSDWLTGSWELSTIISSRESAGGGGCSEASGALVSPARKLCARSAWRSKYAASSAAFCRVFCSADTLAPI